ncbi:hypothetical protein AB0E74_09450 [Streptomyces sp. NPDC030392]|uniref:hypothetical protein n=1 Tax=Streptomyces sp. NPDC030392 TaxID=3155468 RepID=UPI0033FD1FBA
MDWSWWTVLYIAFGVVALWLLGEVLLQYKARLRWRLLAFFGFLGVVAGVVTSSLVLIIAGTAAFGVGQTLVTLSFLRGFSTGWAIGGRPGASRRRRTAREERAHGPALEVTELAYDDEPRTPPVPAAPPVHEPLPLPDDTGEYGVYGASAPQQPAPEAAPASAYGDYPAYEPGAYAPAYDYGTDSAQQQYAAYADPYGGTAAPMPGAQQYGGYDPYGPQQYAGDPYAQQYAADTPPGGVWVPPQRDNEPQFPPPPEQPPAPYGYDQAPQPRY